MLSLTYAANSGHPQEIGDKFQQRIDRTNKIKTVIKKSIREQSTTTQNGQTEAHLHSPVASYIKLAQIHTCCCHTKARPSSTGVTICDRMPIDTFLTAQIHFPAR